MHSEVLRGCQSPSQAAVTQFDSGEAARVKDAHGRCALHFAAQVGRDEACEYLLREAGSPVDAQDENGAPSRWGGSVTPLRAHSCHHGNPPRCKRNCGRKQGSPSEGAGS